MVELDSAMDIELKGAYISHLISLISTNIVILHKYFELYDNSLECVLNTSQDTVNLFSEDKDFIYQGVKEYLTTNYNIELVNDNPITLINKTLVQED